MSKSGGPYVFKLRRVGSLNIHERLIWFHNAVGDKGVHLEAKVNITSMPDEVSSENSRPRDIFPRRVCPDTDGRTRWYQSSP
jgi:hypothetical protein